MTIGGRTLTLLQCLSRIHRPSPLCSNLRHQPRLYTQTSRSWNMVTRRTQHGNRLQQSHATQAVPEPIPTPTLDFSRHVRRQVEAEDDQLS